ncbi:MAG: hypothetical protein SF162_06275 [bacterium]|nr:hypothetical protein [bacterium]
MRRRVLWAWAAVWIALSLPAVGWMQAEPPPVPGLSIPTLIEFASTVSTVRLPELERDGVNTVLSWHAVHLADSMRLTMAVYRGAAWEPILTGEGEAFPASGSLNYRITHPQNFAPPTFRLQITAANAVIDERILTIPYESPPSMARFTASATPDQVNAEGLPRIAAFALDPASRADALVVAWQIDNRAPNSNPVIDQIADDQTAASVEPPRDRLWLPSTGRMAVRLAAGAPVTLRLRVIDLLTNVVYDETTLLVPSDGLAPTVTPPPPTATLLPITGIAPAVLSGSVIPSGSLNLATITPAAALPTLPAPPPLDTAVTATLPPNAAPNVRPPTIIDFRADPLTVSAGGVTRLTWAVQDAVRIEIQEITDAGSLGLLYIQLPPQGSIQVTLSEGVRVARYVLTAENAAGERTEREVVVSVS